MTDESEELSFTGNKGYVKWNEYVDLCFSLSI